MGFVLGFVAFVLIMAGLGCFTGDDGRAYEEYRRAEYRNEYLWERRQQRNDNFLLDMTTLRRP